MATADFEPRAKADLVEIGRFTLSHWGTAQTKRYLSQLEDCCARIAENPHLGRSCDHIRPGVRRFERRSHVIFYRPMTDGIRVLRILHASMQPEGHLSDEDEEFPSGPL